MQQDGIQRAIETKQQQLKPLEAEVRGRSRQTTNLSAWSFLPPGFKLEVSQCTLWHVMGVLCSVCKCGHSAKAGLQAVQMQEGHCQCFAESGRTIGQLPEPRKLMLKGGSGPCMPMCWSYAGNSVL